jgi:UDP-N-acetylglucosamine--N-acetylmuramyl-(pentapeptide) pyrophosphoryl-undecaprenol N-acetylglucosamine transferase
VGAVGRMEMERVPQAGYAIKGLPISGLDRKNWLKNVKVLWNLQKSIRLAHKIIRDFRPDAAIGVGGYASAPTLRAASSEKVPTFLQEQNSYAGVTNKMLAEKAQTIFVAYDEMEKFFPKNKIIKTGNPIRQDLLNVQPKDADAYRYFGISPKKKTLLIVGGSLGARTINNSVLAEIEKLANADINVIWQTGKLYIENIRAEVAKLQIANLESHIFISDFVSRMDFAYSIADVVVSRAGASSISELCLLGKPAILVPSSNVAEDHQTKNALSLANKDAAIMVRDIDAQTELIDKAIALIHNEKQMKNLAENILKLAEPNSADRIAEEIIKQID